MSDDWRDLPPGGGPPSAAALLQWICRTVDDRLRIAQQVIDGSVVHGIRIELDGKAHEWLASTRDEVIFACADWCAARLGIPPFSRAPTKGISREAAIIQASLSGDEELRLRLTEEYVRGALPRPARLRTGFGK